MLPIKCALNVPPENCSPQPSGFYERGAFFTHIDYTVTNHVVQKCFFSSDILQCTIALYERKDFPTHREYTVTNPTVSSDILQNPLALCPFYAAIWRYEK